MTRRKQSSLESAIFFGLAFALTFVFWFAAKQPHRWAPYLFGEWCKFPAVVTASYVKQWDETIRTQTGKGTRYRPAVEYRFDANGKDYAGSDFLLPTEALDDDSARSQLVNYEVGTRIFIRARCAAPHDKAHVAFHRTSYLVTLVLWLLPPLGVGAACVFFTARYKREARNRDTKKL